MLGRSDETGAKLTERTAKLEDALSSAIDDLGQRAAEASSAFEMASTDTLLSLSSKFVADVDGALEAYTRDLTDRPSDQKDLDHVLQLQRSYLQGVLDGGAVPLTIRDTFDEGDWEEPKPVKRAMQSRFGFLASRLQAAVTDWAKHLTEPAPEPIGKAPVGPPPEAPTQLQPLPMATPTLTERKARLEALVDFAESMGVRIKKLPSKPSVAWLDKLHAKLESVANRKGIDFPFGIDSEPGTEETMAFVLPVSKAAAAKLAERVETLLAKAEKAGLKLGKIPDQPSEEWLSELDEKLEQAMNLRRKERREKRERLARQRKDRIARLEKYAAELGVELGKIPPFPTEDWLLRAEHRIATQMLPSVEDDSAGDSGRADRLASVLARASEVDLDLEVPPDPDATWLGWAESQIEKATGGSDDVFAIGEDPDEVKTPTLLFEEGTIQEQRWVIDADPFTVGRARNNGVQIRHDAQLSRQHCSIRADGDGWTVEDLRSTQGTQLNGESVKQPTRLEVGDVITVGDTDLVFRLM